jgi:hypothetical protein
MRSQLVENLAFFDEFVDNFGLEHEDVYMRLFVQTFEGGWGGGGVRTWFKGLLPNSLNSWDSLETAFLR